MRYYKILDISNDHLWEEQAADGRWYPHDGTHRADTRFATPEAARRVCILFPAGFQRVLHIEICEE